MTRHEEIAERIIIFEVLDFAKEYEAYGALNTARSALKAAIVKALADEMDQVALWMIKHGYATGHGDTIADMLDELDAQSYQRGYDAADNDALKGMG